MSALVLYLVSFPVALFGFIVAIGLFLFWRRWRASKKRSMPTPAKLRSKYVPVVESVPFCVPKLMGNLVDIEIQPSIKRLAPLSSSTPKSPFHRSAVEPKVKFSVQYHRHSSKLVVKLLDIKHVSIGNSDSGSSGHESEPSTASDTTSLFTTFQMAPPAAETREGSQLQQRRARQFSYSFEMSYEELQLQSLQFCVMGYDEYSRQRIIGDVLLPLAELSQQGLDITRELVMWRHIQSRQPRSTTTRRDTTHGEGMGPETHTRCNQS